MLHEAKKINIRGLTNKGEINKLFKYYPKVFKITPLEYFVSRISDNPNLSPEDIRIAEVDNNILSSVTVYRKKMYWKDGIIPFAGIGNVSTIAEYRGEGLALKVMKDALQYIEEKQINLSILFTDINKFYEKLNYFTIPLFQIEFKIVENNFFDYEIKDYSPSELQSVSKLYHVFNKNLNGPIYRDQEGWTRNLQMAENNESFLVAIKENRLNGYLRFVPDKDNREITEFAFYDINSLYALLSKAGTIMGKNILKTSALCPYNFIKDNPFIKVSFEPSTIAMACIKNILNSSITKEDFKNYCFWWTDNF